jgi:hypothetical protein
MEDIKMKKIIALFSAALFTVAGFASSPSSWVSSDDGRMKVEKIRIGTNNARIVLESGEKLEIPLQNLDSYSLKGRIYEKKMIHRDGEPTGRAVFMELIDSKNGFHLFRNSEQAFDAVDPLQRVDKFYVFKGEDLHLALDEKSMPSVFNFYELKWSYR